MLFIEIRRLLSSLLRLHAFMPSFHGQRYYYATLASSFNTTLFRLPARRVLICYAASLRQRDYSCLLFFAGFHIIFMHAIPSSPPIITCLELPPLRCRFFDVTCCHGDYAAALMLLITRR